MIRASAFAAVLLLAPISAQAQTTHHDHTAHLGASVMPFDLARTTHVFTPTPDGGTQEVVSKDGDPAQIRLIRQHLQQEARAFAKGDYADPAAIHGSGMPGLRELRAGASKVAITTSDLARGARIRFATKDPQMVAALHQWFYAQVQDHGADAVLGR